MNRNLEVRHMDWALIIGILIIGLPVWLVSYILVGLIGAKLMLP